MSITNVAIVLSLMTLSYLGGVYFGASTMTTEVSKRMVFECGVVGSVTVGGSTIDCQIREE